MLCCLGVNITKNSWYEASQNFQLLWARKRLSWAAAEGIYCFGPVPIYKWKCGKMLALLRGIFLWEEEGCWYSNIPLESLVFFRTINDLFNICRKVVLVYRGTKHTVHCFAGRSPFFYYVFYTNVFPGFVHFRLIQMLDSTPYILHSVFYTSWTMSFLLVAKIVWFYTTNCFSSCFLH